MVHQTGALTRFCRFCRCLDERSWGSSEELPLRHDKGGDLSSHADVSPESVLEPPPRDSAFLEATIGGRCLGASLRPGDGKSAT